MWSRVFSLAILVKVVLALDTIPVFLVDNKLLDNVTRCQNQVFSKTEKSDFLKVLNNAVHFASAVIFFVEDSLCIEDVTLKDSKGTPYKNLEKNLLEKKAKFFINVKDPYTSMQDKYQSLYENSFILNNSSLKLNVSSLKLNVSHPSKYYYIYFEDIENEPRIQTLRRHDKIMKDVQAVLKKFVHGPIISFYTGKWNPIVFKKTQRAAENTTKEEPSKTFVYDVVCGRAQFMLKNPQFQTGKKIMPIRPTFCQGNDSQRSYEIRFGSLSNPKEVYRLRFKYEIEKWWGGEYKWHLTDIQLRNQTYHNLAHHKVDIVQWFDTWNPGYLTIKLEPNNTKDPTLIVQSFKTFYNKATVRSDAPIGHEQVNIDETIYFYANEKNNEKKSKVLFMTGPIIVATCCIGLCLFVLSLGVKMMVSIQTNDSFDSLDFKGVLQFEEGE